MIILFRRFAGHPGRREHCASRRCLNIGEITQFLLATGSLQLGESIPA
jgi:hypothetical protein